MYDYVYKMKPKNSNEWEVLQRFPRLDFYIKNPILMSTLDEHIVKNELYWDPYNWVDTTEYYFQVIENFNKHLDRNKIIGDLIG